MSILFSGDFHAGISGEMYAINKKTLLRKYQREKYNNIKYHIILGDGSFMWPGLQKYDDKTYMELARRPFPVLCVLGNHEPIYGMIEKMPEIDIGIGEKVYQIQARPFVAYLKRGKVYTIDGFKLLVLGGAQSLDKEAHLPHKTWWKEENWLEKEKKELLDLIEKENTFDCVLSHTGPERINRLILRYSIIPHASFNDEVGLLNDVINEWFCGHLHRDIYYYDANAKKGYQYLYRTTKILDKVDNQILVYNEFGKTER